MEIAILQGRDSPDLDRAWAAVSHQLEELHELAESRFGVGVVVLPCREQVEGQYPDAKYQSRIRAIAEQLGFFVVDPLPSLVASGKRTSDLFIPYDRNHPSAEGHRVIGEAIFEYLKRHDETVLTAVRMRSSDWVASGQEMK
jgi:hypothetical protein